MPIIFVNMSFYLNIKFITAISKSIKDSIDIKKKNQNTKQYKLFNLVLQYTKQIAISVVETSRKLFKTLRRYTNNLLENNTRKAFIAYLFRPAVISSVLIKSEIYV